MEPNTYELVLLVGELLPSPIRILSPILVLLVFTGVQDSGSGVCAIRILGAIQLILVDPISTIVTAQVAARPSEIALGEKGGRKGSLLGPGRLWWLVGDDN